ncbi:hypothetical protein V1525DRAFT_435757 [Lipomyces kononenkoae]|uniref:Uncharacterized protein n=1 Tax=Lipomyces kononenkoae TaxID=34357 RepID=A0ACC3SRP7_LIPKO
MRPEERHRLTMENAGTSGGLGSVVLDTILDQKLLAPQGIRLSTFSGQTKSAKAIAAGIEVRRGDMRELRLWFMHFEGAVAVFLVSYPSVGAERYDLHRNAIDAAKKAGVKHIIYTSLTFGGVDGEQSVAGTVKYLKPSGLSWTIIREATYAHLWNNFAGFLPLEERMVPTAGRAAKILVKELLKSWVIGFRDYVGKTINLTGPQLLTTKDIVDLYAKYTGRQVNFRIVGPEEAVEYHKLRNTLPPEQTPFLSNWASWHVGMQNGQVNYVDPTLEQLVGRKLQTIEAMANVLFKPEVNILDTKDFV